MNTRELYRGKRVDNGEWTEEGDLQHNSIGDTWISRLDCGEGDYGFFHNVVPNTVVQSIGLQDVNGILAFHKDKIKYTDDNGNKQIGIIEWNDRFTGYYAQAVNGDDEGNQDGQLWDGNFEIIKKGIIK